MKRIALIVCSCALFVAGSGAASARSILFPSPAQLVAKTHHSHRAGERKHTMVTCRTVLGCINGVYWQP